MSKVAKKKKLAVERIANHLLAEGLNKTGLRLLAKVAGTSDRMLIYYFGSKEALLDEVLGAIATNVTVQLDALVGTQPRPASDLLAQLTSLMMNDAFEPAVQLWFELVGLAARGQEPYLSNARVLSNNWLTWIALRIDDPVEQDPGDLYAHLKGRLMLKMIQG
jgi:AcrR family transcriptional regulator